MQRAQQHTSHHSDVSILIPDHLNAVVLRVSTHAREVKAVTLVVVHNAIARGYGRRGRQAH